MTKWQMAQGIALLLAVITYFVGMGSLMLAGVAWLFGTTIIEVARVIATAVFLFVGLSVLASDIRSTPDLFSRRY